MKNSKLNNRKKWISILPDSIMAFMKLSHILFTGLTICLCIVFYVTVPPMHSTPKSDSSFRIHAKRGLNSKNLKSVTDVHNLALIVPFRSRFEELLEFVPYISNFLNDQEINFHIFIINQVDEFRFNRASLLNVGYMETQSSFDYMALHDVDLLPLNNNLKYSYPNDGPLHLASPYLHPRYHYPTFIGGILLIKREHFLLVDGMSNKYWGWGLEDDEFYARLQDAELQIIRPENFTSGTKATFQHIHNRKVRKRDMIQCFNQKSITRKRDRDTGMSTTRYKISDRKELSIDGHVVTVLNVELVCDYLVTPWCNCTQSVGNTKSTERHLKSDVIVPKINRKIHISPDG